MNSLFLPRPKSIHFYLTRIFERSTCCGVNLAGYVVPRGASLMEEFDARRVIVRVTSLPRRFFLFGPSDQDSLFTETCSRIESAYPNVVVDRSLQRPLIAPTRNGKSVLSGNDYAREFESMTAYEYIDYGEEPWGIQPEDLSVPPKFFIHHEGLSPTQIFQRITRVTEFSYLKLVPSAKEWDDCGNLRIIHTHLMTIKTEKKCPAIRYRPPLRIGILDYNLSSHVDEDSTSYFQQISIHPETVHWEDRIVEDGEFYIMHLPHLSRSAEKERTVTFDWQPVLSLFSHFKQCSIDILIVPGLFRYFLPRLKQELHRLIYRRWNICQETDYLDLGPFMLPIHELNGEKLGAMFGSQLIDLFPDMVLFDPVHFGKICPAISKMDEAKFISTLIFRSHLDGNTIHQLNPELNGSRTYLKDAIEKLIFDKEVLRSFLFTVTQLHVNAIELSKGSMTKVLDSALVCHFQAVALPEHSIKENELNGPDLGGSGTGGLILAPKLGIYHSAVAIVDFTAFYPQIIRNHQLGFPGDLDNMQTQTFFDHLFNIRIYLNSHPDLKQSISGGLKLLMNSFYGILSSPYSRFFYPTLRERIAEIGRKTLRSVAKKLMGGQSGGFIQFEQEDSDSRVRNFITMGELDSGSVVSETWGTVIGGLTDSIILDLNTTKPRLAETRAKIILEVVGTHFPKYPMKVEALLLPFFYWEKCKYLGWDLNGKIYGRGTLLNSKTVSKFCIDMFSPICK